MKSRTALAGCLLCFGAGALLLVQQSAGILWKTVLPVPAASIEQVDGPVFKIIWTRFPQFHGKFHPATAVLENGTRLAVRATSSKQVKEGANGSYSPGNKGIFFKTSDGTDPRSNGRAYSVWFPQVLPSGTFGIVLLFFAAGGILGFQALCQEWPWNGPWKGHSPQLSGTARGEEGRQWGLDILRAAAMLLVLLSHWIPCPESVSPAMHRLSTLWRLGGGEGVDLFFVLSGYLVSGLLWSEWRRTGSINIGRFLCRRGLKIYPAFWFMLLGTLLCKFGLDLREPEVTPKGVIGELAFLQNYVGRIWGPTWSLAVEEHFYLLLAFLFAMLARHAPGNGCGMEKGMRLLPPLFLAVGLICPAIRCLRVVALGIPAGPGNYLFTHCRLDALTFGVFLRYCQVRWPDPYDRVARAGGAWWALAGLVLFVPAVVLHHNPESWMNTMGSALARSSNYLAAGCLVLSTQSWAQWSRLSEWCRPIRAVGRDSYSIYLWHFPVLYWLAIPVWNRWTDHDSFAAWTVYSLVFLSGSILTGALMSKLVERPVLRLRDRFFPSLSRTGSASETSPHPG